MKDKTPHKNNNGCHFFRSSTWFFVTTPLPSFGTVCYTPEGLVTFRPCTGFGRPFSADFCEQKCRKWVSLKVVIHVEMPKAAPQKSICHFQKLEMILK